MNANRPRANTGRGRAFPRKRKILRDNINGVTNAAIRKLARRGGIGRISKTIYEDVRQVVKSYLKTLLWDIVLYVDHANRQTVMTTDVIHALRRRGTAIYGFTPV